MIHFTPKKVDEITSKASPKAREQVAVLVAAVTGTIGGVIDNALRAKTLGKMFGWAALGGANYLRDMPQEIIETFGTPEDVAYALCDRVLEKHEDLFKTFVEHVDAIRRPWQVKVKQGVLKEGARADGPGAAVVSAVASPVLAAIAPLEEAPVNGGLKHQDIADRVNVRLAMVEQLAGVHFDNPDMAERFRHALRSALSGVKKLDEVARQLALVPDRGGLGMGQEEVQEIVGLLERLHAKEAEQAARAQMKKPETPKSILPMVEDHDKEVPMVVPPRNDTAQKLDALIQQGAANDSVDLSALATGGADLGASRKMHDVIARPLTMGPLEELRTLDVTDFRRLATKAGAAVDKIKQKLELLRDDGVDRYAAGIKAWRGSPLYFLYVDMVQEGLVEGRALEDIAASDTNDPERLSGEELQSIVELNKSLRF
ncbi:MAG: hypothetical protein HY437_00410 [Candidatus Magasanikbacteria bacterium]|nr:hypothetical protein [Candidatus Magasanikbacteria bacterium]